ncbi:xyloglucan xylosyltransferase [Salix suchowensis]|nr:xyloglucan xylosyltransferase [Salix suchowensis]
MTDHRHQDLNGHCWLLVIHFLVCSKQMDQQSNLQVYGLLINLLSVGELRLRAETSNPLEVKDELGLHPAFLLLYVNSHAIARICL